MAGILQHPHVVATQRCILPLGPPAHLLRCPRSQYVVPRTLHGARLRGYRTVVLAQRQTDTDEKPTFPPTSTSTNVKQDEEAKWGLFDGKAYMQPWQVPWGAKELAGGMIGWAATFVLVGVAFIPIAGLASGPKGFAALSQSDKAVFALANQVAETLVGLAVVRFAVKGFQPLPEELFRFDLREPFKRPNGWLVWAGLGASLSPLVVFLTSLAVEALGKDDVAGRGTVDAVSSIISLDGTTFAALFTTTAILAPLLEETIFRGFLLTTLTKWMPVPLAVLVSAVAFGSAHFTPRDFPQLTALGVLLGFSYVRSRNLATPMFIHGAWNGTVLTILFMLTSMGVDLNELIHQGQL